MSGTGKNDMDEENVFDPEVVEGIVNDIEANSTIDADGNEVDYVDGKQDMELDQCNYDESMQKAALILMSFRNPANGWQRKSRMEFIYGDQVNLDATLPRDPILGTKTNCCLKSNNEHGDPTKSIKGKQKVNRNFVSGNEHNCKLCEKSFSTHQALGGHMTSHRKDKYQVAENTEGKKHCGGAEKTVHEHKCHICGKVFAEGTSLGGHMTKHRIRRPNTGIMINSTSQNVEEVDNDLAVSSSKNGKMDDEKELLELDD